MLSFVNFFVKNYNGFTRIMKNETKNTDLKYVIDVKKYCKLIIIRLIIILGVCTP